MGTKPPKMESFSMNWIRNSLVTFGGYTITGPINDVYIFYIDTMTWEKL